MQDLINILHEKKCSCVIRKNQVIKCYAQRGIADLYAIRQQEPDFLENASIADKVIGKGAAALLLLGGISQVYADVISEPAFNLLKNGSVDVTYGEKVPHIINRTKTDWCPLEKRCKEAVSAQDCLPIIEEFIQNFLKK